MNSICHSPTDIGMTCEAALNQTERDWTPRLTPLGHDYFDSEDLLLQRVHDLQAQLHRLETI